MSGLFQIICVDNLIERKINLQVGDNIIGNDILTNDVDKPTLSKAINIQITPDGQMSITPFKGVQCYIRSQKDSNWRQLEINTTYPLHLLDTCLLNPIRIWFRVMSAMSDNNNLVNKRLQEEASSDEPPCKRPCSEIDNSNGDTNDNLLQDSTVEENEVHDDTPKESISLQNEEEESLDANAETEGHEQIETTVNSKSDENKKSDPVLSPNVNDDVARILNSQAGDGDQVLDLSNNDSDQVGVSNATGNGVSNTTGNGVSNATGNGVSNATGDGVSNATIQQTGQVINNPNYREKCKYGSTCYRINVEHKSKFSHPGDSDYDRIDLRPECQYGTACYRKNPQHKQDYKHTVRHPRIARTVRRLTPDSDFSDEDSFTESIDESDYDPSFIDDDEYEIDY